MKKCPFCAEDIQDAAIVCKHCGRDLVAKPPEPAPPAWEEEARALARAGKLIHSIKTIRHATGMSLSEAKGLAERWQRGEDAKVPSVPLPPPPQKTPAPSSQAAVGCLVMLLIPLGFCVYFSLIGPSGGGSASAPATTSQSPVDLNAAVRFTGTQIVIENKDTFDWSNVKLEINSGLFSGGYELHVQTMNAGQTYTVGALQFAKSGGERFNPFTHKPQKFSIWCDTPRGRALYVGEWKN